MADVGGAVLVKVATTTEEDEEMTAADVTGVEVDTAGALAEEGVEAAGEAEDGVAVRDAEELRRVMSCDCRAVSDHIPDYR